MASKPSCEAKKYKIVPAAPVTPVMTASQPVRPLGSRKFRVSAAAAPATASSATCAAATGHRPPPDAPVPARSSPMSSSAKHAPAISPAATPANGRPCAPSCGASSSAALAETPMMAGRARTIPIRARVLGRSPRSRPASTENPAVPTALSGPATLNAAYRNPRYRANAPSVPPAPAAAPQASEAPLGRWSAPKGSAANTTTAAATLATRVTWMTLAAREAIPAAKSELPYPMADARARMMASTPCFPPNQPTFPPRHPTFPNPPLLLLPNPAPSSPEPTLSRLLGGRAACRVEDPQHPQRLRAGVLQAVRLVGRQVDRGARPDLGLAAVQVDHALPGQHMHHFVVRVVVLRRPPGRDQP